MILDGKALAKEILEETRGRVRSLPSIPRVLAITIAPGPATESYLRIKSVRAADAGMALIVERFPESVTEEVLLERIESATEDAVIVQLPLPAGIDVKRVLDAIPPEKDADVLGTRAREAFATQNESAVLPPVVAAVERILSHGHISIQGMRAAVIGDGWLVGNPVALWLGHRGLEVTQLTRASGDIRAILTDMDLVVSGAGQAALVTPDMVQQSAVLIDAGTSESGGQMVGDMDPACGEVARLFTPVPGGVGPVAVACLFSNVATLLTKP